MATFIATCMDRNLITNNNLINLKMKEKHLKKTAIPIKIPTCQYRDNNNKNC